MLIFMSLTTGFEGLGASARSVSAISGQRGLHLPSRSVTIPLIFARWSDSPDPERGVVGHSVVAIHARALDDAVDELLGVAGSRTMKIASGEHLAAILLTALVGVPETIDQHGGIDLTFRKSPEQPRVWRFGEHSWAAFEVKSLPGPFRKVDRHLEVGEAFTVVVRSAADILQDATEKVVDAIKQLTRKVGADATCCKCVFLLIHPFDGLAAEAFSSDGVIGHRLPAPSNSVDLDMLWVFWHSDLVAWWSREDQCWTDLIFAIDPDNQFDGDDDPVFRAEERFLANAGYTGSSPWLFRLSANTDATNE
jgi:hypothetical protein